MRFSANHIQTAATWFAEGLTVEQLSSEGLAVLIPTEDSPVLDTQATDPQGASIQVTDTQITGTQVTDTKAAETAATGTATATAAAKTTTAAAIASAKASADKPSKRNLLRKPPQILKRINKRIKTPISKHL